jgi:hypothetical protein
VAQQEALNALDGLFATHEMRVLGIVGILTGYLSVRQDDRTAQRVGGRDRDRLHDPDAPVARSAATAEVVALVVAGLRRHRHQRRDNVILKELDARGVQPAWEPEVVRSRWYRREYLG